jgi:K+-sensing histidine kinase KdpD
MDKEIKELIIVLDILISNHRELLTCEQSKLELIINQDWQGLTEQLDNSRQILKSIETAEKLRIDLLRKIGFDEETPMKNIVGVLSEEEKERIINGTQRLSSVIGELKTLNLQIQELLSSSLEVIDFSISLFQGTGSQKGTYSLNGEEKKGEERCTSLVLDTKA